MSYLDDVNERRRSQSDKQQTAMLAKAMHGSKPQVILTDSTDLGEHISRLGNKMAAIMEAVRADKSTKDQIDRLAAEFKILADLARKGQREQAEQITSAINELKAIIKDQKPIFAPAPSVNLQERDVDLSPLLKKLDELKPKTAKKASLSDFRPIDLEDAPDGNQYLLFEDLSGNWYIMQHDTASNRNRYLFGSGDWSQAWDEKHSQDYKTLSEAYSGKA